MTKHNFFRGICLHCSIPNGYDFINEVTGLRCDHQERCADFIELQGDGRWIWCKKCKSFLEMRPSKPTPDKKDEYEKT